MHPGKILHVYVVESNGKHTIRLVPFLRIPVNLAITQHTMTKGVFIKIKVVCKVSAAAVHNSVKDAVHIKKYIMFIL